jgi:upstream activation factor subunit UAF30
LRKKGKKYKISEKIKSLMICFFFYVNKILKDLNQYEYIKKMAKTKQSKMSNNQKKIQNPTPSKVIEVQAPAVVESPTSKETSVEECNFSVDKYQAEFDSLITQMTQMRLTMSEMINYARKIQKNVTKDLKAAEKKSKKMNAKKSKREPSGFAKPAVISNELCDFLGKPYGTEMARTEVTKYLTTYIKDNQLQQPEDKRKITPDKKLYNLLKLKKEDQVTYFNLQKWMKPHFPTTAVSM